MKFSKVRLQFKTEFFLLLALRLGFSIQPGLKKPNQTLVTEKHQKILVRPGKMKGRANPESEVTPLVEHRQKAGLMVYADAYSARLAAELAQRGGQVFISLAAWAPGMHEPSGAWEQHLQETGLPVLVCNRAGQDATLNFKGSSGEVTIGRRRVAEYAGIALAILTMNFDDQCQPQSDFFSITLIESEA